MEIFHENSSVRMFMRRCCWHHGTTHFHWHKQIEVVQPLEGSLDAFVDGSWYTVEEGEILIVGEGVIHAFRVQAESCTLRLGWFPLSILLNTGVIPSPIKPVINTDELTSQEHLSQLINIIFDLIEKEPQVKDTENNPLLQSLFSSFYFSLMRHYSVPLERTTTSKDKQEFIRIVGYVNSHFTEYLTIQSAAQSLYMDRGKISSLFTKYAGMPLNAYINTLRLERANQLIRDGAGITQAALESGFQSVRTFNDIYKRVTGTTPSKQGR